MRAYMSYISIDHENVISIVFATSIDNEKDQALNFLQEYFGSQVKLIDQV